MREIPICKQDNEGKELPINRCKCGRELDCAQALSGRRPMENDYSVCLYCGAVYVFTTNMTTRPIDLDGLPEDVRAELSRARFAARMLAMFMRRKGESS